MKQNTKRLYSMIIALFFVIAALVWYFDFLVPAYTDLQASKGNQMSEQDLLANETQIVSQFQGLIASYKGQAGDEQSVSAALPVGPHLADAIAQVYGAANANNIAIESMAIGSQLVTGRGVAGGVAGAASAGQIVKPVGTIAFTLSLMGSYENLKTFIATLETNLRLFDVKQIGFQPTGATGGKGASADLFSIDLTAATYYQSQ